MKNLHAYIMVVAFLVMNIAGVAYASCAENVICSNSSIVASISAASDQNQDNSQQDASCDCCTSGHHHHFHASVLNGKAVHLLATSTANHNLGGENYFPQLKHPPSKPPKA